MRFFNIILAAASGLALLTQAAPTTPSASTTSPQAATEFIQAGNSTYKIVPITWTVKIKDNQPNITVTGTVQDVLANISAVDPNVGAEISRTINASLPSRAANYAPTTRAADYNPTTLLCNIWGYADRHFISVGISYLEGVKGQPTNGPGPGNCGRVSYSYSSAIYWCNDNDVSKTLRAFSTIGEGAQLILDSCPDTFSSYVSGQQFYADGWNVIVKQDTN